MGLNLLKYFFFPFFSIKSKIPPFLTTVFLSGVQNIIKDRKEKYFPLLKGIFCLPFVTLLQCNTTFRKKNLTKSSKHYQSFHCKNFNAHNKKGRVGTFPHFFVSLLRTEPSKMLSLISMVALFCLVPFAFKALKDTQFPDFFWVPFFHPNPFFTLGKYSEEIQSKPTIT